MAGWQPHRNSIHAAPRPHRLHDARLGGERAPKRVLLADRAEEGREPTDPREEAEPGRRCGSVLGWKRPRAHSSFVDGRLTARIAGATERDRAPIACASGGARASRRAQL